MKKLLLLISIMLIAGFQLTKAVDNGANNSLQDRSVLNDDKIKPGDTRYPAPFEKNGKNARSAPAISTGYYFVDSYETSIATYWRPKAHLVELDVEPFLWRKIYSGPRQVDSTFWSDPNNKHLGMAFFRNPALPTKGSYFIHDTDPRESKYATDSTNEAFAGPIPLGIAGGFYFNGIRYDSFYVSTNGVIALTNRRYFYNTENEIAIPPGSTSAYDPMSMDWFVAARGRANAPTGTEDERLPDNFGYEYSVLGNNRANKYGGIRNPLNTVGEALPGSLPKITNPLQNGLAGFEVENKAALIAPFWGPLAMNVYDIHTGINTEYSEVYYKRSQSADKLIIYYKNIGVQPGIYASRFGNGDYSMVYPFNPKYGVDKYAVYASAQVILDRNDSSITFQYGRFNGNAELIGAKIIIVGAERIFQRLTATGVRGFARHVDYKGANSTAESHPAEYEQYTHYNNQTDLGDPVYIRENTAVKFKQYKNVLRVLNVEYKVRGQETADDLAFTVTVPSDKIKDYELLAGEPKIGAVQPVITIQNLSNDIQGPNGVNYIPQGLKFRSRIKIINEASEEIVYSALANIDHASLQGTPDNSVESVTLVDEKGKEVNYQNEEQINSTAKEGVPPYGYAKVVYRPFEPSEFDNKFIGRLKMYVIAEPSNPETGEKYGDEWPFDDTTEIRLWVMKRLNSLKDDASEFHWLDEQNHPSVYKWVNLGVQVVNGEDVSKYPLAPRGRYEDEKRKKHFVESPAFLFNNKDAEGNLWDEDKDKKTPDGDQLKSFPIDLFGMKNPTLSFSVQRATYPRGTDYPRGFSDEKLVGPEPRVVKNADITLIVDRSDSGPKWTDELAVEFAFPSPNGIKNITNVKDDNWTKHLKATPNNPNDVIEKVSALRVFGGGGYRIGFLEENKDSALTKEQGLRADIFDDGFDWDFKKFFIRIPSYILNAPNDGKRNFRFRIKEYAYDYREIKIEERKTPISDDDDEFVVDNIAIIPEGEDADLEVSTVKIHWPYTTVPASQATNIPLQVTVSNNTAVNSQEFMIKTYITGPSGDTVYCNIVTQPILRAGKTIEIPFANWNARLSGDGRYTLNAKMIYIGNYNTMTDIDPSNDHNYSDLQLDFSDSYAYEIQHTGDGKSDVESMVNIRGKGLNLKAQSWGGIGDADKSRDEKTYMNNIEFLTGATGGDGAGEIAVKFRVYEQDTLYGMKAFFCELNSNNDNIQIKVYNDQNGRPEANSIGDVTSRLRGVDDITGVEAYNKYVTYLLDRPMTLSPGVYWISIVQRGAYALELGAKSDRMGMRTMSMGLPRQEGPLGNNGVSLLIDKNLRTYNNSGNLENDNVFVFKNSTSATGTWIQFMPTVGNPAYGHLEHWGATNKDNIPTYTCTRGTWLPMIRPYFGRRRSGGAKQNIPCPDPVPVELASFEAEYRNNRVDIAWTTASETDNKGFYVERAQENGNFESITFVEGKGTTQATSNYNYTDKNVENGNTYLYRLKQIDMTPGQCPKYSDVVKVNVRNDEFTYTVGQNPFSDQTYIEVNMPTKENVQIEILDMFGNVVRTLHNGALNAKSHKFPWNGTDANGVQMPSGSYIYRINVNGKQTIGKLTLAK